MPTAMIEYAPKKPDRFIKDLLDFDNTEKSLHVSVTAKNLDRLNILNIENLWLIGPNDKELRKILPLVNLKYLNLYQVLAKDLSALETLIKPETIVLNWNTKANRLWDISKNKNLKTLEITDFSKLEEIDQISLARQIDNLVLRGGHDKPLKIKTLQPLSYLRDLKYLVLSNIRVSDDSLKPLSNLINLEELELSNQFETKEYAWLATRLKNTKCNMFQAITKCKIIGVDNKIVFDTMVTGRRKPFLLSSNDQAKIDKYISDFEQLKYDLKD
jgi:hypothetical protein